ncbi:glycosyltransferase family 4 protein [Variovorax sp. J2P1-59]|uniref:glycosyltransferase family 4 protein n=1 Tax=Variovorax flavidus TaxID=3053501 RepID=UPI002575BF3A|nr:glycosyltransferase family 4 protein [Variovorax sp. J2P1-59]MDM0075418.1 glycosyltransferase family 4 protein [Variovorax sp. J2P1-59]
MKIVFVSPFPLYPATGGNRVRTLHMVKTCKERGHEVHFVFLPSRQMGDFDPQAHVALLGPANFHCLERGQVADAAYLAGRALWKAWRKLTRSRYLQSDIDETYFSGFTSQLRKLERQHGFDAVIAQYVTFTRAFDAFGPRAFRIIDTQDSFAGGIPMAQERRGLLRAHRVLAIQDQEAEYFRRMLPPSANTVSVVSHIIDIGEPLDLSECAGAAFIGSDFLQNNQSLAWFVDNVLPLVRQQEPDFRLFVSGTICRQLADAPGVVKYGVVPRVRDAFREGPILVNSITRGTGVKIKLLEAFGHGVPAVSTQLGVDGIRPSDLQGVLVTPDGDAPAFADAVLRLYRDRQERIERGRAAFRTAASWNDRELAALNDSLTPPAREPATRVVGTDKLPAY